MQILYLIKLERSKLLQEINALLTTQQEIIEGQTIHLQLTRRGGYNGTREIRIIEGHEFDTTWESKDWTRFPARIRALATSLLQKRWMGRYNVKCVDGHLTILCQERLNR